VTNLLYVSQKARFSSCGRYRYSLYRKWDFGAGRVVFVGLNPSRADARRDDPTIRRCIGFARSWGFQELEVVNLFALRATYPEDLKNHDQPVGPENDRWIAKAVARADLAIACWGIHGSHNNRDEDVLNSLPQLHCIALSKDLKPRHPLYLRANLKPMPMSYSQVK